MRIGPDVAQHQLLWPEFVGRVQYAEVAGFDGAWVFDHFTPLYGSRDGPCYEAWTLLAGLAAVTARIRLGVPLAKASYNPRPIQRPHPPIWIGASGEQLMLPIVAR